jgi:hypothetical protein
MKKSVVVMLLLLLAYSAVAQNLAKQKPKPFVVHSLEEPIKVDGILSEKIWSNLYNPVQEHTFTQYYPYDTSKSKTRTSFELAHDDKFLYAAFVCENRNGNKPFVVQSLKRDFSVLTNDAVILSLSPFLDGQNGFSFGVTPYNAQREGAIENGGTMGVTTAWDQVWFSETKISDSFWVAEMAIPFSSIRYTKGSKVWNFNVSRIDYKNNEISNYVKVPRNFNISSLVWEKPLSVKTKNFVLIPYMSGNFVSAGPGAPFKNSPKFGMDAKIALSSSLNLDVTVNPDFANVDVDVQQLNLTRYSLYFPERRQFFIENSDLFANFGFRQIRPFFSRRIGLNDKYDGNIPILSGLRISGKYGNGLRLGAMNVVTDEVMTPGNTKINRTNYTVLAFQKKVFHSSNVGMIYVNDVVLGQKLADTGDLKSRADFNSVLGVEYNLLTKGNTWTGKGFIMKSIYPGLSNGMGYAHATWLLRKTLNWMFMWNHEYVSKHFRARSGFVPRLDNFDPSTGKVKKYDYWRLEPQIKYTYYPSKNKILNNTSLAAYNSSYYDSMLSPTESLSEFSLDFNLQNSAIISTSVAHEYYRLFLPFAPVKLPGKGYFTGQYQWLNWHAELTTNTRKRITATMEFTTGGYFNGRKNELIATMNYRLPGFGAKKLPKWYISSNFQRIRIDLRDSGLYNIDLVGLKIEHSLNTTMYLTGYWQLNAQRKLMNMNLRFQWRYRPMSDIFIVFSQNWNQIYLKPNDINEAWMAQGRSVAAKLVYWF